MEGARSGEEERLECGGDQDVSHSTEAGYEGEGSSERILLEVGIGIKSAAFGFSKSSFGDQSKEHTRYADDKERRSPTQLLGEIPIRRQAEERTKRNA